MTFVDITEDNYARIASIYEEGLATGMATFETEVPSWRNWNSKFLKVGRIALSTELGIVGWAALSAVSVRQVYAGVAELSIYVGEQGRGKGFGKLLMKELIQLSEANNIWTLQSSIFRANEASIHLHLTNGFRQIGFREKVAQLNGKWQDNLLFERRSKIVGTGYL